MFYVEYYDPIAMIIVLHLLNDNRDRVTGFYWSSECDISLFVHTFRKQTWPNIREHMIQIEWQSLQWTNI
jgi:hypothetical protein